jgi:hypothetical protein
MNTRNLRIAFGCQSRVGKSTAAKFLILKNGGVEKSFASSLYEIMYYTQQKCNFEEKKDREFLQMVGSWVRGKDVDTWVNIMNTDIENNENENIFISDVRFNNEFDLLKKKGFIMIKITRDSNSKDFGNGDINHLSEIDLLYKKHNEWDYIIKNNNSLDFLYKELEEIINDIKQK